MILSNKLNCYCAAQDTVLFQYDPRCCRHLILEKNISGLSCGWFYQPVFVISVVPAHTSSCHSFSFTPLSDVHKAHSLANGLTLWFYYRLADSGVWLCFKDSSCFSRIKSLHAFKLSFLSSASDRLYEPLKQKLSWKTSEDMVYMSDDSLGAGGKTSSARKAESAGVFPNRWEGFRLSDAGSQFMV